MVCKLSFAQIGGDYVYSFLQIPSSARHAALGGRLLATSEADASLFSQNPALLDSNMEKYLSLSYLNYFADIQFGNISLPLGNFKNGGLALNLAYANYGDFEGRDPAGQLQGSFKAADYALALGYGQKISKKFRAGVNIKLIASYLESYDSYGLASDWNIMYVDTAKGWNAVFGISDLGLQLNRYYSDNNENLLLNLQLAISKKLEHLPLRWGLVLHHLNVWDLRFSNPNDELFPESRQLLGEETPKEKAIWPDNLLRHIQINSELYLGKALSLRLSYDHQRRREMQIPIRSGRAGFAWGFGLKIKRFGFSYANSSLNLAGASNHFSLNYLLSKN